jgi:hypothetical protein
MLPAALDLDHDRGGRCFHAQVAELELLEQCELPSVDPEAGAAALAAEDLVPLVLCRSVWSLETECGQVCSVDRLVGEAANVRRDEDACVRREVRGDRRGVRHQVAVEQAVSAITASPEQQ